MYIYPIQMIFILIFAFGLFFISYFLNVRRNDSKSKPGDYVVKTIEGNFYIGSEIVVLETSISLRNLSYPKHNKTNVSIITFPIQKVMFYYKVI